MSQAGDHDDRAGHELPAYSARQDAAPKANAIKTQLCKDVSPAIVAVVYSTGLLFSWIVTAISTQRPVWLPGYSAEEIGSIPFFIESDFAASQRIFNAAQIVGSIAYTIMIPVISSVVAAAIAVRLQRDNRRQYSLRQVAMLADRSWNSPLKMWSASSRPARNFTCYLWAGVILTILGLLTFESIKVPTRNFGPGDEVNDIASFMESAQEDLVADQVTADIRSALVDADRDDIQPRLWRNRNITECDMSKLAVGIPTGSSSHCVLRQIRLQDLDLWSTMGEMFASPLPATYSTGTLKQYAPRMQSSVNLSETTLPDGCDPGSENPYYVSYTAPTNAESNWTVTACILEDSRGIIEPTHDRQIFRETAYFAFDFPGINDTVRTIEVTVETAMGYFELPNAANYEEPGLLLETSPFGLISKPCQTRNCTSSSSPSRRRDLSRSEGPNQASFQDTANKGPLAYFTAALFGHGSYVHMQNYTSAVPQYDTPVGSLRTVIGRRPLHGLISTALTACPRYVNDTDLSADPGKELSCLASLFLDHPSATEQMLRSAIFLTSEAILLKPVERSFDRLRVMSDPGMDYLRPRMSMDGIIALSIMHALLAASLLVVSFYTASRRNWTPSLDALTLMRTGAEIGAERLPFSAGKGRVSGREWDELSIKVGERAEANASVGIVSAVGGCRIDTKKKFLGYRDGTTGGAVPRERGGEMQRPALGGGLPSYLQLESSDGGGGGRS